jgi:uncharacterized protein with HEPN domain
MQPEERDAAYLWDMLERACRIRDFVAGKTFDDYLGSQQLQDAVERCVEVVGEAARNVSEPFRASHPEIPWRAIIGQRHVLAHDYDEIRPEIIYRVATTHIPELIGQLEALIPPLPPEGSEA